MYYGTTQGVTRSPTSLVLAVLFRQHKKKTRNNAQHPITISLKEETTTHKEDRTQKAEGVILPVPRDAAKDSLVASVIKG